MIGTLRGMPVMSLRSAQLVEAWERVSRMRASDEAFTVQVAEVNRGGAVCNAFGGLKAFLPGSHYLGTPDESIIGSNVTVSSLRYSLSATSHVILTPLDDFDWL
jgi:ribosomal protein S1